MHSSIRSYSSTRTCSAQLRKGLIGATHLHVATYHKRATACGSLAAGSGAPAVEEAQPQAPNEYALTLRKPVGIVFAQKPDGGPVYVEDVTAGGEADKTGMVAVGDELARCSAVVLKAGKEGQYEAEGYGQRPYDNWSKIMFDCTGQDFKTVMSALKSNNARWGILDVTLVLRRPGPSSV